MVMLQSLISLSDQEIELVTEAVRQWCSKHHCDVDSTEGHRALTAAIDIVQTRPGKRTVIEELSERLTILSCLLRDNQDENRIASPKSVPGE
jgi:hypothetical protein